MKNKPVQYVLLGTKLKWGILAKKHGRTIRFIRAGRCVAELALAIPLGKPVHFDKWEAAVERLAKRHRAALK